VQLYGWCSVPLLGLLFRLYLPATTTRGGALAAEPGRARCCFGRGVAGRRSFRQALHGMARLDALGHARRDDRARGGARAGYARRLRNAPEARFCCAR
jgi:hypothetical protein